MNEVFIIIEMIFKSPDTSEITYKDTGLTYKEKRIAENKIVDLLIKNKNKSYKIEKIYFN